jgi:RNA polymerase sigma-70 factor (ECF subfamily)
LIIIQILESLRDTLAACIQNNPREQKKLYEHYYGYCLKTVFRYVYRYDQAVDVVNDGYIKIFRNFSKFNYAHADNLEMIFMGWIRRIMINASIDHLRRNNFLPEIGGIPDHAWQFEDRSQSPDKLLLYKDVIEEIKRLPPSYRVVFNMYIIDGFTHQEIANQLGIAVGTSKSNLSKARVLLQKFIKKNDVAVNL